MTSKTTALTLYQKLVLYAAGSVVMLGVQGSFSYWKASQLLEQLNNVTTVQLPAARTSTLLDMYHDTTRSAVLSAIVSAEIHDEKGVQEAVSEIGELKKLFNSGLDTLEKLPLHLETKAEIQKVRPVLNTFVESGSQVIDLARQGQIKEAHTALNGFNELFSTLEKSLDALAERVERDSEEEHKAGQEVLALTGAITISGTFLAVVLAVWILRNLVQSLKKFLAEIVEEGANLSETSRHLTSGSIELSESSVQTANALEETSAAIEELNSIVKQNSENSEEAEALSKSSRLVAKEGEGKIKSMIDTIEHVAKSSKKMQQITGVIDDLAFQTNLLALNAAIEAARAGEHGRGFAVVAEAVRGLATRSALAAREINQHIDGSVQIIQQGSAMAADGRQSLLDIVSATEKMCDLNAMVAAGNREQVTGLTQISLAISQIDQGSQNNAAVAEELSASSNQLGDQASHIHSLVQDFQRQVGVYSDHESKTPDLGPKNKGPEQDKNTGHHSLAA